MKLFKLAIVALLVAITVSCSTEVDFLEDADLIITNDEDLLSERLTIEDEDIDIEPMDDEIESEFAARRNRSFDLRLVASIQSPTVNGQQVQATSASVFTGGPRAAVSYNFRGEFYAGALDVLQIPSGNNNRLRLRSGVQFTDANAHSVYVTDDYIWAAHSSLNPELVNEGEFSAARKFTFNGFNLHQNATGSISMQGFAANSVKEFGNRVYITSGDNAGLWVYDIGLSELIEFFDIPDARWVDVNETYIAVLRGGESARIYLYDTDTLEPVAEYPFTGADTPEAKNTVELAGNLALIAAGRSGAHIMDLNDGSILSTIPIPSPASLGLDPAKVETNAVSADGEYIFISNGEAGVYVAEASTALSSFNSGNNLDIQLLGSLMFDDLESVNHVSFRQNHLIVAAGTGGVKAVRLTRR